MTKKNSNTKRDCIINGSKNMSYSERAAKGIEQTRKDVDKIEKEMRVIETRIRLLL